MVNYDFGRYVLGLVNYRVNCKFRRSFCLHNITNCRPVWQLAAHLWLVTPY